MLLPIKRTLLAAVLEAYFNCQYFLVPKYSPPIKPCFALPKHNIRPNEEVAELDAVDFIHHAFGIYHMEAIAIFMLINCSWEICRARC